MRSVDSFSYAFEDLDAREVVPAKEMLEWVEADKTLECIVLGQGDTAFKTLVAVKMGDGVDRRKLLKHDAQKNRGQAATSSKRAKVDSPTPSTIHQGDGSSVPRAPGADHGFKQRVHDERLPSRADISTNPTNVDSVGDGSSDLGGDG
ncbi:hypothetical protein TanjilG_23274 [Lupinus angustifolius]|uniref:Uncharacterized protein n=1 Tax=Lupinus angustifolius TaxID=3871 RepID=A0A1J7GYZ9_LUPAN|nr:hypothetical protein TanjilG_23274 [Lupinus angustifolius]